MCYLGYFLVITSAYAVAKTSLVIVKNIVPNAVCLSLVPETRELVSNVIDLYTEREITV